MEQRLAAIEERNARVQADKAWETSLTRRGVISAITYATAGAFMTIIGALHPWIAAIVPVIGYLLSTLSLPWIKKLWLKSQRGKPSQGA